MELGTVLILFILLVIVTRVFCSPVQKLSPQSRGAAILSSAGFFVSNRTRNFTMILDSFEGNFERPLPNPAEHVLPPPPPIRESNFQLVASRCDFFHFRCTGNGILYYSIINRQNESVGRAEVYLFLETIVGANVEQKISVRIFNAPVYSETINGYAAIIRDI
ncbi:hypothetical protein SAMN05444162_1550 [Paenibacillaceae bacterium GAS479]|nr:hypothetical protein SAMN05444162_1550 [Paenibacillaceae bacterium GAS479]